jgi:hypothetical protein
MADDRKIDANEMILTAANEAQRIRTLQAVLIKEGYQDEPHDGMMRRAAVFDAMADFIARLTPFGDDIRAMLRNRPGLIAKILSDREKGSKDG